MTLDDFKASTLRASAPENLPIPLLSLWTEEKGNWDLAHEILQKEHSDESAWVHAYLHRKEEDIANATYWYRTAGKPICNDTLSEEWADITTELLQQFGI